MVPYAQVLLGEYKHGYNYMPWTLCVNTKAYFSSLILLYMQGMANANNACSQNTYTVVDFKLPTCLIAWFIYQISIEELAGPCKYCV